MTRKVKSVGEKIFLSIGFIVFIIVGFYGGRYIINKNNERKNFENSNDYNEAVAEVCGYIKKGRRNVFEYKVDGELYRVQCRFTFRLYVGEKYVVKYKPSNPEISVVDLTLPVIHLKEYSESMCYILSVDSTINKNSVVFTYIVDNVKYVRELYVKDVALYSIGGRYRIIYNRNNPKVSYFYNRHRVN